jgi:hypothetical protein
MARLAHYIASLPERLLRTATGLAAGLVREIGETGLPAPLRRTRLYQNLVDSTLRFLIEQIGNLDGVYPQQGKLAGDFALRRAAGNGIEMAGILAFRASPVWVMAALADVSGAGRHLVREIAVSLQEQGLLEPGRRFETIDELLAGLERASERIANAVNTPPLDVAALRAEMNAIRREALNVPTPAIGSLERIWRDMQAEAAAQRRSVFELSALMALSTLRNAPESLRWFGRSSAIAAARTGTLLGETLLVHYRQTLTEINRAGFLAYWTAEFGPYLAAAARQFSRSRESLTERLLK